MGDWSKAPWGNDVAADWFQRFWKTPSISCIVDEIMNFDSVQERYDEVRAASYMLQCLGIAYVWPADKIDKLKPALQRAIAILTNMISLNDQDWGFLDMWGNDPEVVREVESQIRILQERLDALA